MGKTANGWKCLAVMVHPNVLRNVGIDPEILFWLRFWYGDGTLDHVALRRHRPAFILRNDSVFP